MSEIETRTMAKVSWRLVPFLMLCYFIAYLDRVNLSFAGGPMSKDLGFSASVFGGAAGIFFIAYFIFEVPSNLALDRFGARLWIARIMFTWGLVAGAEAFVPGQDQPLRRSFTARHRRGRVFPRHHLLPDAVVPRRLSRAHHRPVHVRDSDLDGDRRADLRRVVEPRRLDGAQRLAMDVHHRGGPGVGDVGVRVFLSDRPAAERACGSTPTSGNGCVTGSPRNRRRASATAQRPGCNRCSIPRVIALGFVYMGCNIPQYGLSFFLPQIVKAFGLTNVQAGFVTALPYAVGAIGMLLWGRHSDATKERKWHASFRWSSSSSALLARRARPDSDDQDGVPVRRRFRLLRGAAGVLDAADVVPQRRGAAAGIAAVNSIGNLGGYFGPQVFGWLKDITHGEAASLVFLAACAVIGAVIVLVLGHDPALERPTEGVRAAE